ncbi:MAG: STAS domain-containing protein [Acidobacteriota bacterium]|nr:STAS domain-containing protein [Acidobacteriota bacterium]
MPNPFALHQSLENDLSVVRVEGYLDAHTAPQFEQAIQSEIDAGRIRIIVNCEKLTYISSAGLGVFMSFIEEVREQGGDIKICGLSPKVNGVFEILGFSSIYDICASVADCARAFREAPVREG